MKQSFSLISFVLIILLFCLIGHTLAVQTESSENRTRYVSDFLIINLKSAPQSPFEVVTKVRSDDRLTILERDGSFVKVKTDDGKEGWIADQYLKSSTPKSMVIQELENKITALENNCQGLSNNSDDSQVQLQKLISERDDLVLTNNKLTEEVDTLNRQIKSLSEFLENDIKPDDLSIHEEKNKLSAQVQEITSERDFLAKQLEKLKVRNQELLKQEDAGSSGSSIIALKKEMGRINLENSRLVRENDRLENERMLYWFFAGAIVFFLGMIIGKIASHKKSKFGY